MVAIFGASYQGREPFPATLKREVFVRIFVLFWYDGHGLLSDLDRMITKNCIVRGGGFIVFILACTAHSSGYNQKNIILGLIIHDPGNICIFCRLYCRQCCKKDCKLPIYMLKLYAQRNTLLLPTWIGARYSQTTPNSVSTPSPPSSVQSKRLWDACMANDDLSVNLWAISFIIVRYLLVYVYTSY